MDPEQPWLPDEAEGKSSPLAESGKGPVALTLRLEDMPPPARASPAYEEKAAGASVQSLVRIQGSHSSRFPRSDQVDARRFLHQPLLQALLCAC